MNHNAAITAHIDAALQRSRGQRDKRDYLGASGIGRECVRAVAYDWHKVAPDAPFPGQTLRIFAVGDMVEEAMIRYLRAAGFDLQTTGFDTYPGGQVGFRDGDFAGHCDGILRSGPVALPYPMLWECKALNDSNWRKVMLKGLKESKPIYYAQVQVYMGYFGLSHALVTVYNKNDSSLHFELVPYDQQHAQEMVDRSVRVTESGSPDEFPRLSNDPSFYLCKFCDWRKTCHKIDAAPAAQLSPAPKASLPAWLLGGK